MFSACRDIKTLIIIYLFLKSTFPYFLCWRSKRHQSLEIFYRYLSVWEIWMLCRYPFLSYDTSEGLWHSRHTSKHLRRPKIVPDSPSEKVNRQHKIPLTKAYSFFSWPLKQQIKPKGLIYRSWSYRCHAKIYYFWILILISFNQFLN